MTKNRAVIYSNGIADFRRSYAVEGAVKIAIPVKQNHVADVLASLHVLGDVRLSSPPTFRPANEASGALSLDSGNVLLGLAKTLGGAEVQVECAAGAVHGLLAGVHTHHESNGGAAYEVDSLVVANGGSLRTINLSGIESLTFVDPVVQSELEKALQRKVQRIKPNSTFVELELSSDTLADAMVQYTVPAAAWKISYRLRELDEGRFELQGYAVVDNNTDEDWRDFQLAVVTGEPITFSTDLADSKSPSRRHVDIVRDEALGAVEPELTSGYVGYSMEEADESVMGAAPARKSARRALEAVRAAPSAAMDVADAQESGDFCVYEAQTPVSIDSNRSAVIPVFVAGLDEARSVLHYKQSNHATRPYRSIQFINETGHSLGRGVCTVFEAGVYGGSCIMPASKPKDEALLPHALETGVAVRHAPKRRQVRQTGLRLSDGVVHQEMASRQTTIYEIRSSRDDSAQLVLDHAFELADSTLNATCEQDGSSSDLSTDDRLSDGVRLRFEVPARATLKITVVETNVQVSRIVLAVRDDVNNMEWLVSNVINTNGPLSDEPSIMQCQAIQEELDAKVREIKATQQEVQQLEERQERLRKNVTAAVNASQTSKWLADLDRAEERLVHIEEQLLPEMEGELEKINQRLHDCLKALSVAWSAE